MRTTTLRAVSGVLALSWHNPVLLAEQAATVDLVSAKLPSARRGVGSVRCREGTKALRFPDRTVPAVKIDGERVQGTRAIARELERRKPEPRLFPADAARRRAVEEAERFGDEELQQWIREIFLWSARKDRSGLVGYLEGGRIGMPHGLAARTAGPFIALDARAREATDDNVRRAIAGFPEMLQRIDDSIAEGVLGTITRDT